MRKLFFLMLGAIMFCSCSKQPNIVGSWVTVDNWTIFTSEGQLIQINVGNRSISFDTIQYQLADNQLTLPDSNGGSFTLNVLQDNKESFLIEDQEGWKKEFCYVGDEHALDLFIQKANEEIQQNLNFKTPDLALFELHGHVNSVEVDFGTVYYTYDGKIKSISPKYSYYRDIEIERDDTGFIKTIFFGTVDSRHFTFDKENVRLEKKEQGDDEGYSFEIYNYDSNGQLVSVKSIYEEWSAGEKVDRSENDYDVKILETDNHGNWIKRQAVWVTKRDITYYD